MNRALFVVVLTLLGPAATLQAEEDRAPFQILAGKWERSLVHGKYSPAVLAKDGVTWVSPELTFFANGQAWSLGVGGTPPTVYWNPGPSAYDLIIPDGAKKGVLALVVADRGVKRQVRFEYTLKNDTLTIDCKDKVHAGTWLGDYSISGEWVRFKRTSR